MKTKMIAAMTIVLSFGWMATGHVYANDGTHTQTKTQTKQQLKDGSGSGQKKQLRQQKGKGSH